MIKHTPPPWHDDGYRIYAPIDDDGRPLGPDEDRRNGRVIVEYKHILDFNQPDGPLIAAAPELLEACRDAAAFISEGRCRQNENPYHIICRLRDAIAKAEQS